LTDNKNHVHHNTVGRWQFTMAFVVFLLIGPLFICFENGPTVTAQTTGRDDSPQGLAPTAWPMIGQNPQHTSLSEYLGPMNGEIRWNYSLKSPEGYWSWGYPVMGIDGTIYIGSYDYLYAISPFGDLKWRINISKEISSTPAIDAKGDIIFVAESNMGNAWALNSLNSQGQLLWTYNLSTPSQSSPAIGSDGTIYLGTYDNSLIAVNPDGTPKWTIHIKHGTVVSPAIGSDGTIYMSSLAEDEYGQNPHATSYVIALKPDGTEKWRYNHLERDLLHTPMIGPDGSIYLYDNSTHLLSLTSNGRLRWIADLKEKVGGWPDYWPILGPTGTIYARTASGKLYSVDQNGSAQLYFNVGQYPTNPIAASDGSIFIANKGGDVMAISPDGSLFFTMKKLDSSFFSSPIIGSDGTLYISGDTLYALGGPMNKTAPVRISTKDITRASVHEKYLVDYATTYFNASKDVLTWALSTNATWLTVDKVGGVLQGTPSLENVGSCWVNISVSNSTTVLDHHNFTLEVIRVNHSPRDLMIVSPKDGSSYTADEAHNLLLSGSAIDDDVGDVLNFTWSENGAVVAKGNSTGHSFAPGTHIIMLMVSDGQLSAQTSVTFKVTNPPKPVGQSSGQQKVLTAVIGISVVTVVILGLVVGTEAGKYGSMLGLAPLYSKTRKDAILDNFTRGKIYQYVWSNPGAYFNLIKKTLDLNTGTVIFHLDKLETEGFIRGHRDGLKKRFYPTDLKSPAMPSVFERILAMVRLNPGLSQRALCKALDLSPSTVHDYVHKMEAVGQLTVVKDGKLTKIYLGSEPES